MWKYRYWNVAIALVPESSVQHLKMNLPRCLIVRYLAMFLNCHCLLPVCQMNNTGSALGQVIVLPNPGSAQYNSAIQKVMSCHICLGKSFSHILRD